MLVAFIFTQCFGGLTVNAAAPGVVVINEVGWAGSADSANDEWIELYNSTNAQVDLSGWVINDDQGQSVYALTGVISAHGYYLIEDAEISVQPNAANLIVNLSLANSGDSLVLFDASGGLIDKVNSSGGAWFAGNSTTHASMERIDALASGDSAANWVTSNGSASAAVASAGSHIMGTPGIINSQSQAPVQQAGLVVTVSTANPAIGDTVTINFSVDDVTGLFSYGLEVQYDPAVLTYVNAAAGTFLGEGGSVPTSFQAALENGQPGKLIVAEARTQSVKTGVNGTGVIAHATFNVIGGAGSQSQIQFGNGTFLADSAGDISTQKTGATLLPSNTQPNPVNNLAGGEDAQRYSIKLQWVAPAAGADKYRVYRKNAHGTFVQLGETAQLNFTDSAGGKIIPGHDYSYRITAVKGAVESAPAEVQAAETRGLKGDNNRSDRVDGRDLENLARHFAETDQDPSFDALADTTYDAQIDGSDLIDLGLNFAKVY